MAYQTFRVEITRYETRDGAPVGIEITAYIDRMPETNEATVGRLSRAWRGGWESRLQFTRDFETLWGAQAAVVTRSSPSHPPPLPPPPSPHHIPANAAPPHHS